MGGVCDERRDLIREKWGEKARWMGGIKEREA